MYQPSRGLGFSWKFSCSVSSDTFKVTLVTAQLYEAIYLLPVCFSFGIYSRVLSQTLRAHLQIAWAVARSILLSQASEDKRGQCDFDAHQGPSRKETQGVGRRAGGATRGKGLNQVDSDGVVSAPGTSHSAPGSCFGEIRALLFLFYRHCGAELSRMASEIHCWV